MGIYKSIEIRGFFPQVGFWQGSFDIEIFNEETDLIVNVVVAFEPNTGIIYIHSVNDFKIPREISGIEFFLVSSFMATSGPGYDLNQARKVYQRLFRSS